MYAGEEGHTRPGWTTSRRGQDSPWKSHSEWQRTEMNGESTSLWMPQWRAHSVLVATFEWHWSLCLLSSSCFALMFTPPTIGERNIVMSVSVCLSVCVFVCPQSYLQNYTSDLHQFFVRVTHGRGSVLLWRHCDDCLADKREDRQNCSVMPACCLGAYVNCIYITAKTFFTFNVCYF